MMKIINWQVSVLVKLLGIVLIGLSAAMIGCQMSWNLKKRIDMLVSIRYILEELANEACYGREILGEIIHEISRKVTGVEKEWLLILYDKIKITGECAFYVAWKESLLTLQNSALKKEDLELIENFGTRIVNLNEDRLNGLIGGYVAALNERVDNLKTEYGVKARLYKSLGVLVGLFIIIVVI